MEPLSKYAINFDERCTGWCAETKYNRMFVMHLENWFNELLRSRGYVFLRDIYENLGTPITRDSCIAGWKRDNESDDVFVKITIQEVGRSSNLALDFNVEENILDKFE